MRIGMIIGVAGKKAKKAKRDLDRLYKDIATIDCYNEKSKCINHLKEKILEEVVRIKNTL